MNVVVEVADVATPDLLEGVNRLVPQLSSTAGAMTFQQLADMIGSPCVTFFVAKSEGRIVGMLTLATFAIPTGLRAWIEDVVVDNDSRGLRIGDALTVAALDVARELGAKTVDLTSRPSRASANALYQRLGFEQRATNVYRFLMES
ncbi:MAG: GNAT family N-acetyltransferase [Acidobacteria bacterium]|nr:GNAT family N-acetyltransferase [Acidobacteriota bacterium]